MMHVWVRSGEMSVSWAFIHATVLWQGESPAPRLLDLGNMDGAGEGPR